MVISKHSSALVHVFFFVSGSQGMTATSQLLKIALLLPLREAETDDKRAQNVPHLLVPKCHGAKLQLNWEKSRRNRRKSNGC